MNRLGLIIYREWITRVRRRAFIIGTLLVPVLLALGWASGLDGKCRNGGEQGVGR